MSQNLLVTIFWLVLSSISMMWLIPIWIASYIFRSFVIVIAKVIRSDLGSILSPTGVMLADDDFSNNFSHCSIVTVLRIKKSLGLSQVTDIFNDNVIQAKVNKDSKTLRYPELQQYPVNFLGYPFWKRDKNFSLSNHIVEHSNTRHALNLSEIHETVMNGKYPKYQSPWKLSIFRNGYNTDDEFLALRLHHSIGDGRSVIKLLVECLGNKEMMVKEAAFEKRMDKEKIRYLISLPFGLVCLNADLIRYQMRIAMNPWKVQEPLKAQFPFYVRISNELSLAKVKETARSLGTQTSVVILSVVTSAIGKFSRLQNHSSDSFSMYLTLPKKSHPRTLVNHLYFGMPDIPMLEDDIQLVRECEKIYYYMRQGDHGRHMECMTGMIATFPKILRLHFASIRMVSFGLSNIAGEQEEFKVGGYPCLGFTMSTGLVKGTLGIGFTVLSYKDHFQVGMVANGSLFTENDADTMAGLVEKEFLDKVSCS